MNLNEVSDILLNVRFDYVATARDCHRLRKSKTAFNPDDFILIKHLDRAIREIDERAAPENLDEITESLRAALDSERAIVDRVWLALGVTSLSEAKNYTISEYVKWMREDLKSCVEALREIVTFLDDYLKYKTHPGVSRLSSSAKQCISSAERFTTLPSVESTKTPTTEPQSK